MTLDIVHEAVETPQQREAFLNLAKVYGVEAKLLQEDGPAGGNPEFEFVGPLENLYRYYMEQYAATDTEQDAEYAQEMWEEYPPEPLA
jgi:hypothetical protein